MGGAGAVRARFRASASLLTWPVAAWRYAVVRQGGRQPYAARRGKGDIVHKPEFREHWKTIIGGWAIIASPALAIGLYVSATGSTTDPPRPAPAVSEPADTYTPEPPAPDNADLSNVNPSPLQRDCGDGTTGTYGECWQRGMAEVYESLGATTPLPGMVCRDGWISRSVGSGTCSHHGGIAP